MIKFKQKSYTIQEGHYTGPKDIDKVPGAVEMIAKGAGVGAVTGGVVGAVMKDHKVLEDALTGAKWGSLGGLVAKFFLNYVHKPMTAVKYQEVDKNIRRQFGVYQITGITVGDSLDKRAKIEDKFSFNDRNVSSYKLNIAIHNNQVILYTFGLTKEELEKVNKTLDYYCKKYFSMEYTAKAINLKANSYSVNITFTNYHVLVNFIMELSEVLGSKINLLNNNAIVEPRLAEADEKNFSIPAIGKYDLQKILGTGLAKGIFGALRMKGGLLSRTAQYTLLEAASSLTQDEIKKLGVKVTRGDLNNKYLESLLKKLKYVEGYHYTTGTKEEKEVNISLISGILIISATKDEAKEIDDKVWKSLKTKIHRSDTGNVIVYSYPVQNLGELEMIVKKTINSCNSIPNIFG